MPATSPPIALPVAAAVTSVLAAVLALSAVPSAALAERWLRPVPGEVARTFAYARGAPFAPGAHRGLDLGAPPGTAVRSACAGRVAYAGRVAGQGVVSVRCGARRVTHLPLRSIAVHAGAAVRAGAPIGTLAAGHHGLHLGVRVEADPFGYVDPLALLPAANRPLPPVAVRRGRPRRIRVPPRAAPLRVRAPARPPVAEPRVGARRRPPTVTAPVTSRRRRRGRSARRCPQAAAASSPPGGAVPWPVWAGMALVLSGVAGSSTVAVRRRRGPPGAVGRALRTSTPQ